MATRVRFRFNKRTGEVEEFLVDDQDRRLPEEEHDRIAAEVGGLLAASPRLHEVRPGASPPPPAAEQVAGGPTAQEEGPAAEPVRRRGGA